MKCVLFACAILFLSGPASAQSFSCSYGKRAACLDYGDQVCGSLAKCVDESASCFNSYQCNYEGFTCKSNVTEIASEYDELVGKYNELLRGYDELVGKYKGLSNDYDKLLDKAKNVASSYDNVKNCLLYADDLEEAQLCGGY